MEPPRPPVELPVNNDIQPLFPDADVPLLRTIAPEAPLDNTFDEDTPTTPDPLLTLDPLHALSEPPTPVPSADPLLNDINPPTPLP